MLILCLNTPTPLTAVFVVCPGGAVSLANAGRSGHPPLVVWSGGCRGRQEIATPGVDAACKGGKKKKKKKKKLKTFNAPMSL